MSECEWEMEKEVERERLDLDWGGGRGSAKVRVTGYVLFCGLWLRVAGRWAIHFKRAAPLAACGVATLRCRGN